MIAPDWYPSLGDIVGSSLIYMAIMLPFVLMPLVCVRRLVKGAW